MEQLNTIVPLAFIESRIALRWADIEYGMKEGLVDPRELPTFAAKRLVDDTNNEALFALACLSPGERVTQLVAELASKEGDKNEEEIRSRWLYLVLAWLYKHREEVSDALSLVERIYADFDYPPEVAPFVRYMPGAGPDLGCLELNEARMYEKWRAYLERARAKYSGTS